MPKKNVAKKPEKEVAIEEVLADDTVLSREDFLQQLRSKRQTAVVEGCRVQSLSAEDYQAFKGLRYKAAVDAKGEDREEKFKVGECAAWLALGVKEPAIDYKQWLFELGKADGGTIERIVEKIKDISGATDLEVELAKKVLEQIQDGTTN